MLRCFQIMETSTKRVSIFWVTVAVVVVIALVITCRVSWRNVPFDMKRAVAPNPQLLPCGGTPASTVELGYPYVGTSTAEFTTAGAPLFVTARHFAHGLFVPEGHGATAIYVGSTATPPTWDEQRSIVSNTTEEIFVKEGEYGELMLPAGRFWLWSGSGGDIVVVSCIPNGVSDPHPRR